MKIKELRFRRFKRFTDLTIKNLPATAKMVVVVGPNGSGKSSLFEAFNVYLARTKNTQTFDAAYHVKTLPPLQVEGEADAVTSLEREIPVPVDWSVLLNNLQISFHGVNDFSAQGYDPRFQKAFYIRSSYRNEADFSMQSLNRKNDMLLDENRPQFLISQDTRVSDNYGRIVGAAIADIFTDTTGSLLAREIRERLIGEVRNSVLNVLPELTLTGVGDPFGDGTFFFKKGRADNWRYKNLSGGEKAAFDLLLDFIIKKEKFNDTIFCVDEPELHMNTSVQAALLQEMYAKVPDACQLWISTHSIGMMRCAKELSEAHPGAVVFLDFAGRDFDKQVEIEPAVTDREFWKRTFAIAMGDLVELVAPSCIVFCEGSRTGHKNAQFDAQCFHGIFSGEFPDTDFVSLGGANEVEKNSLLITSVLKQVLASVQISKVVDRDDRSDEEVQEHMRDGTRVLSRRHLEAYLLDNEILEKLCHGLDMGDKAPDLLAAKDKALSDSVGRGCPTDDVKSASGAFYVAAKKILSLNRSGSNFEAFCLNSLVPLVTPETSVYAVLRKDVLGV